VLCCYYFSYGLWIGLIGYCWVENYGRVDGQDGADSCEEGRASGDVGWGEEGCEGGGEEEEIDILVYSGTARW